MYNEESELAELHLHASRHRLMELSFTLLNVSQIFQTFKRSRMLNGMPDSVR